MLNPYAVQYYEHIMDIMKRIMNESGDDIDRAATVSYTHLTLPTICSV